MTSLPIVERELRLASRKLGSWLWRWIIAIVAVCFGGLWLGIAYLEGGMMKGDIFFAILAWACFVYCLLAGLWTTSDTLTREKNDGTLGLLFLTDLRGYDVVLGKMITASLKSFYGVLAVLPVLALPLLMGGVTNDQFWRTAGALLNILIFSLSLGMFFSALSWSSGRAIFWTFLSLFSVTMLPLIHFWLFGTASALQFISPGFAMAHASAPVIGVPVAGSGEYWPWLGGGLVLSAALLALASWIIPHRWREAKLRPQVPSLAKRTDGDALQPSADRQSALLDANPAGWLVWRMRSFRTSRRLLVALMITVGLAPLGFVALEGVEAGLAMIVGMYVVFCLIASFFLKLAANWITKLDISFGKALGITAASCLVGIAISVMVGLITLAPDPFSSSNPANFINAVVLFLTTSLIYSSRLKIKFGSACLMALIVGLLTALAVVVLLFFIGLLSAGALFGIDDLWIFMASLIWVASFWIRLEVARHAVMTIYEAKASGALEQILVTPVDERQFRRGHFAAMVRFWMWPVIMLASLPIVAALLSIFMTGGIADETLFGVSMMALMSSLFAVVFFGDLFALYYSGCWFALRGNSYSAAFWRTFGFVYLLPTIGSVFLCWLGQFVWLITDIIFIVWPLTSLQGNFRRVVSGEYGIRYTRLIPSPATAPTPPVIESPNR
ncbi:MAG: hypothetical protein QF721_03140 [Verrucomicrobiota bacterium]|jgi:hypothetical protein|nr:hypothetical protein [Verrucomicrobiota bacterium]